MKKEKSKKRKELVTITPSDWGAAYFVDLNFKVDPKVREKHWKEAALRGVSRKKLYLMAMIAFYEKNGSMITKLLPELVGIEQDEIDKGGELVVKGANKSSLTEHIFSKLLDRISLLCD